MAEQFRVLVVDDEKRILNFLLSKLKFSKVLPYAFTEHGAIMAASVLNSERAAAVSVFIVRAFVALRRTISQHKEVAVKIAELERRLTEHDHQIVAIVQAIKELISAQPVPERRRIDFRSDGA